MHNNGTRFATLTLTLTLTLALGLGVAGQVQAEQVTVPVGTQADRSHASLPENGMSQKTVKERWGSPQEIRQPVGQPPISQWHYPDFIVYFEGDTVLHTVMKRSR